MGGIARSGSCYADSAERCFHHGGIVGGRPALEYLAEAERAGGRDMNKISRHDIETYLLVPLQG